jgi:hypothetical protein
MSRLVHAVEHVFSMDYVILPAYIAIQKAVLRRQSVEVPEAIEGLLMLRE